jgi:hypothetical protein
VEHCLTISTTRRGWKTILVMLAFLVAFSGDVAGMRRGYPHRI